MIKALCVVAAMAFHSLPDHLRPQPCDGMSIMSVRGDNSADFYGDSPAPWFVRIGPDRRVLIATFNGRTVRR
jgi:hypothetical protein